MVGADWVEAHVWADEVFEFGGVDFAEAFEASDFGSFAAFGDGFEPFFFGVAVERFLFIADAEERSLEDEEVAAADDVREELEEESDHEEPDVHAIDVGVGGEDDLLIAEVIDGVLDIERVLEEIEFLVFVDDLFGEAEGVEGFAAETEDGLGFDAAGASDGAAGAVAFGDEERAFLAVFGVGVEVDAAVAEFFVMDLGFAGAFAGDFGDASEFLAFAFVFLDFFEECFVGVLVAGEVELELFFEEGAHEGADGGSAWFHDGAAEFGFGLGFEDRFDDFEGDGGDDAAADV